MRIAPAPQASLFRRRYEKDGQYKVSGEDSEERTNRRWAFGSRSGSYYRGSVNVSSWGAWRAGREGGELRPKGPTVGKEKLGIMVAGGKYGKDSEPANRITATSAKCFAGCLKLDSLLGSTVMRQEVSWPSGYTFAD